MTVNTAESDDGQGGFHRQLRQADRSKYRRSGVAGCGKDGRDQYGAGPYGAGGDQASLAMNRHRDHRVRHCAPDAGDLRRRPFWGMKAISPHPDSEFGIASDQKGQASCPGDLPQACGDACAAGRVIVAENDAAAGWKPYHGGCDPVFGGIGRHQPQRWHKAVCLQARGETDQGDGGPLGTLAIALSHDLD